jgi:cell wall-associated NlpC family hydrolase
VAFSEKSSIVEYQIKIGNFPPVSQYLPDKIKLTGHCTKLILKLLYGLYPSFTFMIMTGPRLLRQCTTLLLILLLLSCKHRQKQPALAKQNEKRSHSKTNTVVKKEPSHGAENNFRSVLKISSKDLRENKLYAFVDEWYGVPYKYGGCDKKGVDCSCFTNLLYQQVYRRALSRSAADIFASCGKLSLEDAKQGDLLFFKIGGNTISHVGIYIGSNYFVHSSTSKGVILNSLEEAYYKKYFFCAGKIKNA